MPQLPITLSGNLTDDPTCIAFDTGSTLTRFRLATSRRVRTESVDTDGNALWTDTDMLYIDVECWGQLAVNVSASLTRGMPAIVVGRLVSDKWTDENGTTRYKHIVKANQVALELSRHQTSSRCTTVQENTPEGMDRVKLMTREDLEKKHGVTATRSADASAAEAEPHAHGGQGSGDDGVIERTMSAAEFTQGGAGTAHEEAQTQSVPV